MTNSVSGKNKENSFKNSMINQNSNMRQAIKNKQIKLKK